jgi:hypothetical protein
MNAMMPQCLSTADKYGNLMPSFVGSQCAEEAKKIGWVENYDLKLGGFSGVYQRLTPAGVAVKTLLSLHQGA